MDHKDGENSKITLQAFNNGRNGCKGISDPGEQRIRGNFSRENLLYCYFL
jgi:hypothetical protein